jgi:hypothetical protein
MKRSPQEDRHCRRSPRLWAGGAGTPLTIITQAEGDLRDALPFFSKQSLANAVRELFNMGYQVRLKKITANARAA